MRMNAIRYTWILINRTACCIKQTNHPVISSHIFIRWFHIGSQLIVDAVLLNSMADMSAQVLYMWCLSTADPNYLNVALILRIQGIVKLNQGQPEVNDGQNYLGGSQHSSKILILMWLLCRLNLQIFCSVNVEQSTNISTIHHQMLFFSFFDKCHHL